MNPTDCTSSPTLHGYGGEAADLCFSAGGALPNTGLDLLLLAVGGLILFGVGIALRRAQFQNL